MITRLPIHKKILEHWNTNKIDSLIVAIEEMSELQKELTKVLRYKQDRDKIIEELTDVLNMCQAIQEIYKIDDIEIFVMNTIKQARTIERIENNNL